MTVFCGIKEKKELVAKDLRRVLGLVHLVVDVVSVCWVRIV